METPYSEFFQQWMDLQMSFRILGPSLSETCEISRRIVRPVQKQTANLDIHAGNLIWTGNCSCGVKHDGETVEIHGIQFVCRDILTDQSFEPQPGTSN